MGRKKSVDDKSFYSRFTTKETKSEFEMVLDCLLKDSRDGNETLDKLTARLSIYDAAGTPFQEANTATDKICAHLRYNIEKEFKHKQAEGAVSELLAAIVLHDSHQLAGLIMADFMLSELKNKHSATQLKSMYNGMIHSRKESVELPVNPTVEIQPSAIYEKVTGGLRIY